MWGFRLQSIPTVLSLQVILAMDLVFGRDRFSLTGRNDLQESLELFNLINYIY